MSANRLITNHYQLGHIVPQARTAITSLFS
ncbi:hypothetical protein [Bradyrhizobium yuanmingense]